MTSGQSGPYGDPGRQGQQPEGHAPPPQPPYGQQPRYGQQYPGYAPAPSAPSGYGAPAPMDRPTTVRVGIGALVASLVLGLIQTIGTFADVDGLVQQAQQASGDPALSAELARTGVLVGAAVTLLVLGLMALFVWFAWKGRNWARIVIWVVAGISVLFSLVGLAAGAGQAGNGFLTSLSWFATILDAVGIVALALTPSNDWYRYRGWQRATGQG